MVSLSSNYYLSNNVFFFVLVGISMPRHNSHRFTVAELLSRLHASHNLLVKKGHGNDTTKHFFLSALIELCTYGLDVNVQAFRVLTLTRKGGIWPHSQYPIFDCLQSTKQGEWKAWYISIIKH